MAIWSDLETIMGNDPSYNFSLTYGGEPFDLTEATVKIYLKQSQADSDADATVFTDTAGIFITNDRLGLLTWGPAHSFFSAPGTMWYRLDVINSSSQVTTFFVGNFFVTAA